MTSVNKKFSIKSVLWFVVFSIMVYRVNVPAWADSVQEGVCARVSIRISQKATISRTAFNATLKIENTPENGPLDEVEVLLKIETIHFESANELFAIPAPVLSGISDVTGTGTVLPGTTATAAWTLTPSRDAAPETKTQYYVGGTFSYMQNGTRIEIPIFPATISVMPDPQLVLDYFWVRDVYSDDPFTEDIIEPAEPFPLGLILRNQGKGTAKNVRIESSPPEIIDNEKGLLVDFLIVGSSINDQPGTNSLDVDLGDVGPDETAVSQWMMTASLQGKFQKYSAGFEHLDELGDQRTSLIESVNIHELFHAVRVEIPDDGKPDFLVNEVEDDDHYPDTLFNSDGSVEAVRVIIDAAATTLDQGGTDVTLSGTNPVSGWVYIRIQDPGNEEFELTGAIRPDNTQVPLDQNAWTTHRTIRIQDEDPYRENLLHLFDYIEAGNFTYTLRFKRPSDVPEPPVMQFIQDRTVTKGTHFGVIVKASDPNGTIPTLTAAPIPAGAGFIDNGNGSGYFEWDTDVSQPGIYIITFTASDGELTASRQVTYTITQSGDSDEDQMADEWEIKYFGDLARDGSGDYDGDGLSDLDEFLNGSHPANATLIHLEEGFNMITLQDSQTGENLKNRLPRLEENCQIEKVMALDPLVKKFHVLVPGDTTNPDYILAGGEAILIYSNDAGTVFFGTKNCHPVDLKQGLNLVGFDCSPPAYTASALLLEIGIDHISNIQRFNLETGAFETVGFDKNGNITGVDFAVVPGTGYFINMKDQVDGFMP